jgi:hypothetical protein
MQLPTFECWLRRKDPRLGRWEKRFVKLTDNKVFIYASNAPGLAPIDHFALTEHVTIRRSDPTHFEFQISGYYGKEFTFRASDLNEFQQCLTLLEKSQEVSKSQKCVVIDIHFLDGYKIPVAVKPSDTTAEDVY